jgi:putative ABC transport system permease protein
MTSRHGWGGSLVARLKPDVTQIQAQQNMESVVRALIEGGALDKDTGVEVRSLHEWTVASSRQMLLVLLGAVGCILLIACVNVAGLLIARGAGRSREVAIRASLGAGRARLLRQLLTESLVLATLGGAAGIGLVWLTLGALVPMLPVTVPTAMRPSVDLRVLGFVVLLSGLTGVVSGLFPALRLSRLDFVSAVKEGGDRSAGLGRRTGATLVVVEVALALVLLVGAGLMVRSFQRLMAVDAGFDPERVLVVETFPVMDGDGQVQRARTFYAQLTERLSALPGVGAVGAIDTLPFSSWSIRSADLEGLDAKNVTISSRSVLPGYFRAMGIPLRMGRDFTPADREGAPCVAVVNQSLAKLWPDGSPLGRRVRYEGEKGGWCEIVGVIGDVRHQSLEREIMNEVYMSGLQTEEVELTLVARVENPAALAAAARAQISGLSEPPLILRLVPFETLVARSAAERRRRATLLTLVSSLGVLLAGVGIFGLTSYAVARRTPEIGVRVALGATPQRVLQTIVGGFVPAIASGVILGLLGAWAATQFVSQYLFGVTPTDALTLTTVSMLLVGIALLACYLPARRALRVDPVVALRAE